MLEIDLQGDIGIVRLTHGKANALDLEFCRELQTAFRQLEEDVGAVVVTGRGSIFSAGVDLLRVLDEGPEYTKAFVTTLSDFCEAIFGFSKPMIAAINGHAIAGGCVIACMADRRFMARGSGRVGVPELLVGVPFPAAPLEAMRFAVPSRFQAEVIYGGATYEADAALERGLIDEIVEPEQLLDRALHAAKTMARLQPEAFRLTKMQLRRPAFERMRAAAKEIDPTIRAVWAQPETQNAIRDYVARTLGKST